MKQKFLGFIAWLFYKSLSSTWKITIVENDLMKSCLKNNSPFILAHWHGDELALIHITSRYKLAVITSLSKDGEIMATLLKLMGAATSRGSSSRGGISALKGLIKLAKNGWNTSFAVDGPRGPIYKVKPGVFEVAKLMHAPIFVSGVACDKAWHFPKAWNKTYLPKPFAKIYLEWHVGIESPDKDLDPKNPELSLMLETRLNTAKELAAKSIATI